MDPKDVMASLPPLEQGMVSMRYLDGIKVSEIARLLDLPQQRLYRRQRNLDELRAVSRPKGCTGAA